MAKDDTTGNGNGNDNEKPSWPPVGLPEGGLVCRSCGCRHFYVVYTRRGLTAIIVRRRECRNCHHRVTTYEKEFDGGNPE